MLVQEGADAKTYGMFCVAVVQSVFIFGLDTWVLMPRILKALENLRNRAARRISGRVPRQKNNGS